MAASRARRPRQAASLVVLLAACALASLPGGWARELAAMAGAPEAEAVVGAAAGAGECCARLAAIGTASELPVFIIDTSGAGIEYHGNTSVALCTCSPAGSGWAEYAGAGSAGVRGTTSSNATKKSYSLKLRGAGGGSAAGTKQAFPLLGLPEDSNWVLYGGDEVDLTQGLRNYLAYNLARRSGRYASRTRFVELFLRNDTAPLGPQHYAGIYMLLESVERGKERVDVAPLRPPNLSGGFIFVFDNDNIQAGDVTFGPTRRLDFPFQLKYPAGDANSSADAMAWLLSYLNDFEDALFAPAWLAPSSLAAAAAAPAPEGASSGARPARGAPYTSFIDGPSFVDYMLLTEVTKNPDGYRGSTFLHKDRDAPLRMGPAWDYNEAFGLCCGYPLDGWQNGGRSGPGVAGGSAISPEGWRFRICEDAGRCKVEPTDGTSLWYRRMWRDPRFRQAANTRWRQLRAGNWSDAVVQSLFDDAVQQIRPAALRNYDRYKWVLARPWYASGADEWTAEVAQLRTWLLQRLAWLDGAFEEAAAAASVDAPGAAPGGR